MSLSSNFIQFTVIENVQSNCSNHDRRLTMVSQAPLQVMQQNKAPDNSVLWESN